MNFPPITVAITTFNRDALLKEAVIRLRQNLYYSGKLTYLVSADGDMPPADLFAGIPDVTVIPGPNRRFGGNLNNLLKRATTDLIFQTCEDINLLQPLYLDAHARKLMEDETAGWVRLMWIGSHDYTARLEGAYWRVSWDSASLYIPSCRPHLKHIRFHEYYGLYQENCSAGVVEESFCHACIGKHCETGAGPDVLVPLIGVLPDEAWQHTGVGENDVD